MPITLNNSYIILCISIIREEQWKLLDNHRRKLYVKFELKNKLFKSIIKNHTIPLSHRYLASFHKSNLPRSSSIVKQCNRCVQTGRSYSVLRKTQSSRFHFRFESYKGLLPGVRRHS